MKNGLLIFLLFFFSAAFSQHDLDKIALEGAHASFDKLYELLSIPNDAHFPEEIEKNFNWAKNEFTERGFKLKVLETPTVPLLLAEKNSQKEHARTMLAYLQFDGQPTDPSHWFQEDPYKPVLKEQREGEGWVEIPWQKLNGDLNPDWRVFARSASDAKGPCVMYLAAIDALEKMGRQTDFHLKVIMDFEEELGSPQLPKAVEKYRTDLAADAFVIFDGPRHISNEPTLTFGARGIATITLTVFGPTFPQHSGHYGNYCPNPALKMSQLLASMKDPAGRVTIPGFYDGIYLDEKTKAILAAVPDNEEEIRTKIGVAKSDGVAPNYQEALQYPSLNIRGLQSGWVREEKRTIVPASAIAEIDVRLVLESDPERLIGLIKKHIEDQGYLILDRKPNSRERVTHANICQFESEISYKAFRTEFDSDIGKWLSRAMVNAFGKEPVKIRTSGGSIPISPFVTTLGVPAVTVPTVNRDNNQHSPNENIRVGNYVEGIKTILAILLEPM
ncbi:MAG: M20/M25/M40 family metallo-hydrolase [Bacteroidota bacterium]